MNEIRPPTRSLGHVVLRDFRESDGLATYGVFFKAVRTGAAGHYTMRQRVEWASNAQMPENWTAKRARQITRVAQIEGRIVGFMSLETDGYLDMAFVTPSVMGTGVAGKLYDSIEDIARNRGIATLTVRASHLAKPFLSRRGWKLLGEAAIFKNGQQIPNFDMKKDLN